MRVRVFLSVRNHPVGILLRIFTTHSYTLEFPSLASRHTQFGYSLHAQAHAHKRKFFVTFASDEYVFCTRSILFVFLSHLFYFPFFYTHFSASSGFRMTFEIHLFHIKKLEVYEIKLIAFTRYMHTTRERERKTHSRTQSHVLSILDWLNDLKRKQI